MLYLKCIGLVDSIFQYFFSVRCDFFTFFPETFFSFLKKDKNKCPILKNMNILPEKTLKKNTLRA